MSIDISKLNKRYYTIAEVSKLFKVAKSLLRYWEGEFSALRPKKDRSGIRRYTVKDIEKIQEIYDLLKVRGFTIEGAKRELSKSKTSVKQVDVKQRLIATLTLLKEIRSKLNVL